MRLISAVLFIILGAIAPLIPLSALAQNPQIEVKTSMGNFTLELYQDKAPKSVANFMQYMKEGFFKDTIFHRVIDGFMIQGGGFDRKMQQKPTRAPIDNEAGNGLKNDTGTIAMARTSAPHSATAQFYINVADNVALNHREPTPQGYGYAVFGRVTKGMDVVMRIAKVTTGSSGPYQDVPTKPIIIEAVTLVTAPPATSPTTPTTPATTK